MTKAQRERIRAAEERALAAARAWCDADSEDDAAYFRLEAAAFQAVEELLLARGWKPPAAPRTENAGTSLAYQGAPPRPAHRCDPSSEPTARAG